MVVMRHEINPTRDLPCSVFVAAVAMATSAVLRRFILSGLGFRMLVDLKLHLDMDGDLSGWH